MSVSEPGPARSAELYVEMGKFGIPAKHHEAIALIYSKVRIILSELHLIALSSNTKLLKMEDK